MLYFIKEKLTKIYWQSKYQVMSDQAKNKLHEQLIEKAKEHNLEEVKRLLKQGADPNFILRTDINGWYSGNTHTALYEAVHAGCKDEKRYTDVIEVLLEHKANPNFKACRGGWNHSQSYPTFLGVVSALNRFKDVKEKIRLIEMFVKHGINLNQNQSHGRSKGWRDHRTNTCFFIRMMDSNGFNSQLHHLAAMESEKIDVYKLSNERQNSLRKQFNQDNMIQEQKEQGDQEEPECENSSQQGAQNKEKKVPSKPSQDDLQLIKALLEFGCNPNSGRFYHYWEDYDDGSDVTIINERETALHRAIMHNSPELVKLLLDKGADPNMNCCYSIQKFIYPKDWPEQKKLQIKERNQASLKQYENQKKELQNRENNQDDEDGYNQEDKKKELQQIDFQIYKAKKYIVDNDFPTKENADRSITCLQLAEKLKVDQQIIEILKKCPKPQKKVQEKMQE